MSRSSAASFVTGARVAAAARGWIGTPYLHQASTRGAGTDCLGLLRGIWREVIGAEPEIVPPYTPDWSEPAREERLWAAALRHLLPLEGTVPQGPGEVLLFRMRAGGVAKHLGISGVVAASPGAGAGLSLPAGPLPFLGTEGGPGAGRNGRRPAPPGRSGASRAGTPAGGAQSVAPGTPPSRGTIFSGASFIHAYSGHAVVESPLSAPWRRRIVARFAFPEGDL